MPHEVGLHPTARMDVEKRGGHRGNGPKPPGSNCDERDGRQLRSERQNVRSERYIHIVPEHLTSPKVLAQHYGWAKVIGRKTKLKSPAFCFDQDTCSSGSVRPKPKLAKTPTALDRPLPPASKRQRSSLPPDRKL